jgi:hypothetical protein
LLKFLLAASTDATSAQVPSARKKLVVPPPEGGTKPCKVSVKVFKYEDIYLKYFSEA